MRLRPRRLRRHNRVAATDDERRTLALDLDVLFSSTAKRARFVERGAVRRAARSILSGWPPRASNFHCRLHDRPVDLLFRGAASRTVALEIAGAACGFFLLFRPNRSGADSPGLRVG